MLLVRAGVCLGFLPGDEISGFTQTSPLAVHICAMDYGDALLFGPHIGLLASIAAELPT